MKKNSKKHKKKNSTQKKLDGIIEEKENELKSIKKKLDVINEIREIAKLGLKSAQSEAAEAKKLKAQLMY